MAHLASAPAIRPALTAVFLALIAAGVALSTLSFSSVALKIVLLVVAGALLAATGASLALVIARSPRSGGR